MKLIVRISKKCKIESRIDISDWLWQFYLPTRKTPMRRASQYGHLSIVRYLHENGADIHEKNDRILIEAIAFGHLSIVKYLHMNGVDIHIYNEYPLRIAAYHGHLDIIRYLHENGADIQLAINSTTRINDRKKITFNISKYFEKYKALETWNTKLQ